MQQPTPGPLYYDGNTKELPFRIVSKATQGNIGFTYSEADACLFSASRDLLTEIETLIRYAQGGDIPPKSVVDRSRATIYRASVPVPNETTRPPIDPQDARQFVALWTSGYSSDPKTEITGIKWFCEERGYDFEDITAIEALEVGETWISPDYGDSHQVIRFV